MSSPKLLPCPFCGGDEAVDVVEGMRTHYWVQCWMCSAVGGEGSATEVQAVRLWNTRVMGGRDE